MDTFKVDFPFRRRRREDPGTPTFQSTWSTPDPECLSSWSLKGSHGVSTDLHRGGGGRVGIPEGLGNYQVCVRGRTSDTRSLQKRGKQWSV